MKNQKDEAIFHEAGTVGCLLNTEWDGMDEERGGAGQCSTDIKAFPIFGVSAYLLSNLNQRSVQQDLLSEAFDRGVKQY